MNYYPHHVGDYTKDTIGLTQGQHGAYRLLMDAAYTTENGIPADEVYPVSKAVTAAERKNTDKVLAKYFVLRDGRYYQKRIEAELEAFRNKSKKAKESANARWGKAVDNPSPKDANAMRTHMPPQSEGNASGMLTSNQEPKPKPEKRIPDASGNPESAASRGAAALQDLRAGAKIDGGAESPAAVLAMVLRENNLRGNAFHPLVVEWSREGITVERLKAAITKARSRPGKETGTFGPEYLDPILHDESKPAAQVHAEKASQAAAKSVEKAQRQIAEQRALPEPSPVPEHLRKFVKAASA